MRRSLTAHVHTRTRPGIIHVGPIAVEARKPILYKLCDTIPFVLRTYRTNLALVAGALAVTHVFSLSRKALEEAFSRVHSSGGNSLVLNG